MCDCIKNIDAQLKPNGQCLDATMFSPRKMSVTLIRTDKWVRETRRSKPSRMITNFCPFCGEKYPSSADTKQGDAA